MFAKAKNETFKTNNPYYIRARNWNLKFKHRFKTFAKAIATGIIVTCIPIDVPIQVDMMQQIRKIPGISR